MPTLETPPNPAPPDRSLQSEDPSGTSSGSGTVKVRTSRYGELEEHELIHLLDALDDDRARSRFRESVYISLFVYIALAWFLLYGPQVIFHQPRVINPGDALRQQQKELTYLDMPPDVAKQLQHKPTDKIAEKAHTAQTVKPTLDKMTLQQLRAMRGPAAPTPTPLPPAPQPQQQAPPQQAQQQPQPTPLPQHQPVSPQTAMVDAPKPQPRTNFNNSQSAGSALQQAARGALQGGGQGGVDYDHAPSSHGGLNTGVDVLSDTEGVDFGPYLTRILREIKSTWLPLIPEEARPPLNKQGVTQIRFSILPDGNIGGMTLEGSTHDDALNRAAWGSITGVHQFPPLPSSFKGPNLELRIHYLVNKNTE